MAIADSVRADINAMPQRVRSSGLASAALVIAERLDAAAARDTAPLARELRATLADLRTLAAAIPVEADPVDELEARRTARLAKAQAPKRAGGANKRGTGSGRPRSKRGAAAGPVAE